MTVDIEPYEAGYMKPPKEHRFKAGQTGNPKGRPKRIDDPFTVLEKVLARRIPAGQSKITIQEALIRLLRDRALSGDRRAIALQQKILILAAATLPVNRPVVDTEAAKQRLLDMAQAQGTLDDE